MLRSGSVVVMSLAALACQPKAETPEQAKARMDTESAAARQAIEASDADYVTHFNQGHGDIVAQKYVEDATLMIVGQPVASGRQAIAAAVNGLAPFKPQLTIKVDAVHANGPLAVERGTYSMTVTPPGAPGPLTENGTYMVTWHQVDGKWMMGDDMATSDKPLPPPPEAPAKGAKKK